MRAMIVTVAALAAAGCTTFGVEPIETSVTVRDDRPIGAATLVRIDATAAGDVVVAGGAEALAATLDVTAWVAEADGADPAEELRVDFRREGEAIRIDPGWSERVAEHVTVESVGVEMPDGLDLDVSVSAAAVRVHDVGGRVSIAGNGASIEATLAHGGHIAAGDGPVAVRITGGDFDLLSIESGAGAVTLEVPEDLPLTLDLAAGSESTITLEIDGGRIAETGTSRTLELNGGGPLIHVRTQSNIEVSDGTALADR